MEVVMFTGTTLEELLAMVQRAENNAETEFRLEQEIRRVPVLAPEYEYYRPQRYMSMVGVA